MKKTIFIWMLALLGCSNSDDSDSQKFSISGQWEWVEYLSGNVDPIPEVWEQVNEDDKFTYNFFSNGEVEANNINCVGNFNITTESVGQVLNIIFPCLDVNYQYIINVEISSNEYLYLSVWGDLAPPEGLLLKFKKIN